jgi:hypothetical protein
MNRRQLLARAGTAAAVASGLGATSTRAETIESRDSWTGVVTALDGTNVRVRADHAAGSRDATVPLASEAQIRVGDVMTIGSITAADGPAVASPLFFELDGTVGDLGEDAVTIGRTRVGVDSLATARPARGRATRATKLRQELRTGDRVHALCIANRRDGSRRVAVAYVERLGDD